jgi:tetratricopeptide (TPR) repeat protein
MIKKLLLTIQHLRTVFKYSALALLVFLAAGKFLTLSEASPLTSLAPLLAPIDKASAELFLVANQSYDAGEYQKALTQYLELLNRHHKTSEIYFNIGNTYFRKGDLGKAIYFFQQALQINPANGNAQFNLNFAREKAVDRIQLPAAANFSIAKLSSAIPINYKNFIFLALGSFSAFLIFWGITLHRRQALIIWSKNFFLATFIVCSFFVFLHLNAQHDIGVITAKSADVKSAIGKDGVTLFVIHEGTEFYVEKIKEIPGGQGNAWLLISLYDGKRGWVNLKYTMTQLNEFADLIAKHD